MYTKYDPNALHKFHNFPNDPILRDIWLQKCRVNKDFNHASAKVCTDHFLPNDYERNFKEETLNPLFKRKLKKGAVPYQLLADVDNATVDFANVSCEPPDQKEICAVVDENMLLKETLERLTTEVETLQSRLSRLQKRINHKKKKQAFYKGRFKKLAKISFISQESNILSKVFSQAQANVLLGNKKVVWSDNDMAMGFTLRQMGSKECYLYLKNTLKLPLPSLSSVQKWVASK